MFKSKKTEFPPRPRRPTWEEMEEDLEKTTKSDIVFTLNKNKTEERGAGEERQAGTTHPEALGKDNTGTEELFLQAVEFVEKNDELIANMELLAEERERLQEVSESLRETVEGVKKQALVAIGGY